MLNEFAYCPRLFYLEWVLGQFEESADTLEGQRAHKNLSEERGAFLQPEESPEEIHARSVFLSAPTLGLSAKIDLIEGRNGQVVPVDYKRGEVPDTPEQSWEPERIQLCAQGLILRENGYTCECGVLYYSSSRRRIEIRFTEELIKRTLELRDAARAVASSLQIPPPLVDSPKCPRCSLVGICLPDEVNLLSGRRAGTQGIRRLIPSADDALPLYIQEQGHVLAKSGDTLEVRKEGNVVARIRLIEVSQVCLFGNVQITTQALRSLCELDIPVCYFSYGGWFYGMTHGMAHKNIELRIRQFATAADPIKALQIARRFVEGKIQNQRTLLRRNCPDCPDQVLKDLANLASLAATTPSLEALIGIEGAAAQLYFLHFADMLKHQGEGFHFTERNRRPPTDPVNAVLSLLYAILAKDLTVTAMSVGFDPYLGFLHRPRYGRPALALDLMEEFRPIICDSVALSVFNTGEIGQDDFVRRGSSVNLTERGRRTLLRAYERRMSSEVTHPLFGYTVSYRRVLEIQTRLLARCLSGEIPEYPPFRTR